tara:strand:+ start:2328 stop:3710 length:1383 start_codon:yes stop_codon:yes gene_type:complete
MKIKKICCIGAGYVGGPTMAVIALKCSNIEVTVVDIDKYRIDRWNGSLSQLPIYEPGLKEVVAQVRGKNLFFSTDIDGAVNRSEMIFMAVNTPTKTQGEGAGMAADLKYVEACAKKIAQVAKTDKIVVEKSTLPVRTAEKIKEILTLHGSSNVNFEILSNPEFLAEGTAVQDLFKSDRVLVGGDPTSSGQRAIKNLVDIYAQWIPKEKILTTNIWSSELAKLASNAMLAQRISSINSLSALCEKTGANIDELSKAIGMDHRIGSKFLKSSVGFGGSCFQKDILNLVYLCRYYGLNEVAEYWNQVVKINDYQKLRFSKRIINELNNTVENKKITILGWAFKANTNDSRESAAIYVSEYLINCGAKIRIFDPMVSKKDIMSDLIKIMNLKGLDQKLISQRVKNLSIFSNLDDALRDCEAVAILTSWDLFKKYDWKKVNKSTLIFDGHNILSENQSHSKYFPL